MIALATQSWATALMLSLFGVTVGALLIFRRGRSRAVTLHGAIAMLLVYQTLLLKMTASEPNIGIVWFLAVPAMVALLGTRNHVLIWTPITCGLLVYCWTLYAPNPSMAHALALPNLIGVTLVISMAALGVITQRDRREKTLKYALNAARQEAEQRKQAEKEASDARHAITTFLGSMSHELRTPLTSIVLATEVLEQTGDSGNWAERGEWLTTIQECSQSLILLLNDVLDLAKSDAGTAALNDQPFEVEELLVSIRAIVQPMAVDQKIQLIVSAMPDVPRHWSGDVARVRQVLINLINNALQHSAGSWVGLDLTFDEGLLHFTVSDNGRGIPAAELRTIFQPFHQLSQGVVKDGRSGTGLGLTIAQGYVDAMGGELTVQSEAGEGTRFHFSMSSQSPIAETLLDAYPRSAHWASEVTLSPSDCVLIDRWNRRWLDAWKIEINSGSPVLKVNENQGKVLGSIRALKLQLDALSGVSVDAIVADEDPGCANAGFCLICDDNPQICRIVSQFLARAGYQTATCVSGSELLTFVGRQRVDVIILDFNLGQESGLDVLRQLRALPTPKASIPVCMLSGSMDHRNECLSAGAEEYLLKPSGGKEMIAAVQKLLKMHQQ